MAENSAIEWTNSTWNPTVGCSVISAGCTNCYAMKMAGRLEAMGSPIYAGHTVKTKAGYVWNGAVAASNWGQMIKPLSWKKPRRIFVNSMSDLFHEDMQIETIDYVFAVMAMCPQHTFQVLTKRHTTMRDYCQSYNRRRADSLGSKVLELGHQGPLECLRWPLPNVWLGVSVEDQFAADYRIPALLETPAAVRFLSCEPLLGPIKLWEWDDWNGRLEGVGIVESGGMTVGTADNPPEGYDDSYAGVDWVICGGESGPKRRPMDLTWARSLRDQCSSLDVPYFFKQVDKVQPIPHDLLIREFPGAVSGLPVAT